MPARVIHANISDWLRPSGDSMRRSFEAYVRPGGFLGTYFVAIDNSHGISIEVFETEELARATSPTEGAEAPWGDGTHHQYDEVIGSV